MLGEGGSIMRLFLLQQKSFQVFINDAKTDCGIAGFEGIGIFEIYSYLMSANNDQIYYFAVAKISETTIKEKSNWATFPRVYQWELIELTRAE